MIPGLYLVHKPAGRSSFDLVRDFKAEAAADGERKLALGHGVDTIHGYDSWSVSKGRLF